MVLDWINSKRQPQLPDYLGFVPPWEPPLHWDFFRACRSSTACAKLAGSPRGRRDQSQAM